MAVGDIHPGELGHLLREQWRAKQWTTFAAGRTRTAARCGGVDYFDASVSCKKTIKLIAELLKELRAHALANAIGAYVSDALRVRLGLRSASLTEGVGDGPPVQQPCRRCGASISDQAHEWWTCAAISERPAGVPRTMLQRHLGWSSPAGDGHDRDIIVGLARVRRRTIDEHYRPGTCEQSNRGRLATDSAAPSRG